MTTNATQDLLRARMGGPPIELATAKVLDHLDAHCRAFIALSPFLVIGGGRADGSADVSPRGDPPGFVVVLDARTLLIPERPGNRRLDTIGNLLANPAVGVLFFVPGVNETLRVNGRASVVDDPDLLAPMAVNGKPPIVAIKVAVDEAFLHCGKALARSRLWDAGRHVERAALPSLGRMIVEQARTKITVEDADKLVAEDYRDNLY